MELLIIYLLLLFFALALAPALYFLARGTRKSSDRLPPGPAPLPVIGNLLHLGDKPHKSLSNLANIHGPIMSLKLGQVTTIVISSPSFAKEILQIHDLTFSNRTVPNAIEALSHHEAGMPWLPVGQAWRNLRKICNSYLFTAQQLDANQDLRRRKIQQLIADVDESCRLGEAIDIGKAAFKTSFNALSNTVFSLDLSDSNSDTVREFKQVVNSIMEEAGKPNLADYFPLLRKLDLQKINHRMSIHFKRLYDLFDSVIDERVRLRKELAYIPANDMLDTLLTICEDKPEEMDTYLMKRLFLDLFSAGTDTTSSTVEWAMAELLCNPNILLIAKAEIEQSVGKGKMVEESDIDKLPYLHAIMKETLRLHPAAPLLLPRKAGADVKIGGFMVPKGAQVLVNAWAIGRDPSVWENPNSFIPERFLGSDTDVKSKNFELIPFGGGRRICPGLPLAIKMLHLMLGSLINCFDWKLEDGVSPLAIDMEDKFGLTLQKAHPLRALPLQIPL